MKWSTKYATKTWKWWFGRWFSSSKGARILRFQPLIFRGVGILIWTWYQDAYKEDGFPWSGCITCLVNLDRVPFLGPKSCSKGPLISSVHDLFKSKWFLREPSNIVNDSVWERCNLKCAKNQPFQSRPRNLIPADPVGIAKFFLCWPRCTLPPKKNNGYLSKLL